LKVTVGYLFKKYGDRPFESDHRALSQAARDLGCDWTPHDLRRTCATRMADLGVAPHIIEKILNHKMDGMMAVYNHSEYLTERRAASLVWGRAVARVRKNAYRLILQRLGDGSAG
jgi:integrase